MILRRSFLVGGVCLVASHANPSAALAARPRLVVYRSPNCRCCGKWVEHARATQRYDIAVQQVDDVTAIKRRLGVPDDLWSCHTSVIAGIVVEGHVPLPSLARLLRERPAGIRGVAVPGMPAGSPGMEIPGQNSGFAVVAFGPSKRLIFDRVD